MTCSSQPPQTLSITSAKWLFSARSTKCTATTTCTMRITSLLQNTCRIKLTGCELVLIWRLDDILAVGHASSPEESPVHSHAFSTDIGATCVDLYHIHTQQLHCKCCINLSQNQTRNKSIVPSRTMHTGVTLPRRVLITMSVITMRSIFRKLCVRLFTLCKISTAIFE